MCVFACVCMCACMCVYVYLCVHVCACMCMCSFVYVCLSVALCVCRRGGGGGRGISACLRQPQTNYLQANECCHLIFVLCVAPVKYMCGKWGNFTCDQNYIVIKHDMGPKILTHFYTLVRAYHFFLQILKSITNLSILWYV